jgi:uncharacterized membrane protein YkoI
MKMHTLLFTALAAASASAAAASPAPEPRLVALGAMVAHLESTYKGKVTAIQLDAAGDKPAHYHVDIRFPQSGLARIDVDAVTRDISAHEARPLPPGSATLPEVTTLVGAQLPGEVTIAELDAADGVEPHYDVDVRVPGGKIARLKIDALTRGIGWRQPAVIDE